MELEPDTLVERFSDAFDGKGFCASKRSAPAKSKGDAILRKHLETAFQGRNDRRCEIALPCEESAQILNNQKEAEEHEEGREEATETVQEADEVSHDATEVIAHTDFERTKGCSNSTELQQMGNASQEMTVMDSGWDAKGDLLQIKSCAPEEERNTRDRVMVSMTQSAEKWPKDLAMEPKDEELQAQMGLPGVCGVQSGLEDGVVRCPGRHKEDRVLGTALVPVRLEEDKRNLPGKGGWEPETHTIEQSGAILQGTSAIPKKKIRALKGCAMDTCEENAG